MSPELIIFVLLIMLGYVAGTLNETKHYKSIEKREQELLHLPAVPLRSAAEQDEIEEAWLVSGSVVVSIDYFKSVLSSLQNLIGGGVGAYESLLDRARREAVLRMKEDAKNADIIINTRLETSAIGGKDTGRRRSVTGVEVIAYGTALRLKKAAA